MGGGFQDGEGVGGDNGGGDGSGVVGVAVYKPSDLQREKSV